MNTPGANGVFCTCIFFIFIFSFEAIGQASSPSISLGTKMMSLDGHRYFKNECPELVGYYLEGTVWRNDIALSVQYSEVEELNILGPKPSHSLDLWSVVFSKHYNWDFLSVAAGLGLSTAAGHIRGDSIGQTDSAFPTTLYDKVDIHEGWGLAQFKARIHLTPWLDVHTSVEHGLSRRARYFVWNTGVSFHLSSLSWRRDAKDRTTNP